MMETRQFIGLRLFGGFLIREIVPMNEPLVDVIEREAIAQTTITG